MAPRPPFTGTVLSGSAGPQVMEGRRPGVASCPLRTGDISSIHPMRASPSPQHRPTRDQDAGSGTGHLWPSAPSPPWRELVAEGRVGLSAEHLSALLPRKQGAGPGPLRPPRVSPARAAALASSVLHSAARAQRRLDLLVAGAGQCGRRPSRETARPPLGPSGAVTRLALGSSGDPCARGRRL